MNTRPSVIHQLLLMLGDEAPVTPPITGMVGWWDASQFASLTLSTGSIVAAADLSGHGNDIASGSGPPYNATGFTGRPAFDFNGTGGTNGLSKSSFSFGAGNTLTAFFAGQMTTSTTNFGRAMSYFAGGSNDADNNASWLLSRNSTSNAVVLYRNGSTASSGISLATPFRCIATVDPSGVMTIYINGVATTGATLNAAFGASGTFALGIAAFSFTSAWNAAIGEAGVSHDYNNATAVAALDLYLKNKWGL